MPVTAAADLVFNVAVAFAVQRKVAQKAQQIAEQQLPLHAAVDAGRRPRKEGRGRGVVDGVAGGFIGIFAQRVVIKQDVGPLQPDAEQIGVAFDGGAGLVVLAGGQHLFAKAAVCVDSGHGCHLISRVQNSFLRPSRTARRKAKKPSRISGAMTMTPVEVLPDSWVRALTRKVPTKDAPLPQMSRRP